MANTFWSLHTHSRFSVTDALPHIEQIVEKAQEYDYPALGITDHGSIAGLVSHYSLCRKAGIEPAPGIELYVTDDSELGRRGYEHLIVAAYTEQGYRNLCGLATLASRKFHFRPRVDMADFAELAEDGKLEGLAVSTGCIFGVVEKRLITRGEKAARRVIEYLAGLFPRCYVELQNHGIDVHDFGDEKNKDGWSDDSVVEAMYSIACGLGLPVILTQDSHYCDKSQQALHDRFKEMVSWSDDVDDAKFPGDGYHMVDADYLSAYFPPKILQAGLEGLADLSSRLKVRIPEIESFQSKVPDVTISGDAQAELEERVITTAKERGLLDKPAYGDRIRDELDTIKASGSAGMILLTAMLTDWMTKENIWFGARGSASGSAVLWLCGITQLDPIESEIDFTRFLSKDRTKLPDIDLDVEHARRPEVREMLERNFTVAQVGTLMTFSLFDDEQDDDNAKGALLQRYHTVRNKKDLPKIAWKDIPDDDKAALETLAKMELISGYGKHPAGFILAPDEATLAQMPMAYIASSQTTISAFNKKDVEKLGFIKLDVLGLKDRTAFRITGNALGYTDQAEFEASIPFGDKDTFKRICNGQTEGVFQLQGYSMMKGCQRLQPKTIEDLAAAQALFRPAATGSGATSDYLARRKGRMKEINRHEDIASVTGDTYGVLLYQDQMVEVLRQMGLPPDELTEMLDAVKASNKYSVGAKVTIEAMLPKIRDYAVTRGWDHADIQWLADALEAFADYSFNKAHATAYAVTSYRSAYLSTHHPLEFWVGLLTAYLGAKKEPYLVAAARRYGVRIYRPHVNRSGIAPVIDNNGIRRSLISVKKVGNVVGAEIAKARGNEPFKSLRDFGQRVNNSKVSGSKDLALGKDPLECGGVVEQLYDSGALEGLT